MKPIALALSFALLAGATVAQEIEQRFGVSVIISDKSTKKPIPSAHVVICTDRGQAYALTPDSGHVQWTMDAQPTSLGRDGRFHVFVMADGYETCGREFFSPGLKDDKNCLLSVGSYLISLTPDPPPPATWPPIIGPILLAIALCAVYACTVTLIVKHRKPRSPILAP